MATKQRRLPVSRTTISRRSGYSLAHVSKVFSGTRRPSVDCAQKFASAIGWTVDELLDFLDRVRDAR